MCFRLVNQSLATEANGEEICVPLSLLLPCSSACILSQGDSCLLPHTGAEDAFSTVVSMVNCLNNGKLHTCRLLARGDGRMTNAVFPALPSG